MRNITALSVVIILIVAAAALAAKPDLRKIADRVAGDIASVKEGDTVFIGGSVTDVELLEQLALAAARRGANPQIFMERTAFERQLMDARPPKNDPASGDVALKLAELPTVQFFVGGVEDPDRMKGVPAERIAATQASGQRATERLMKRNVRVVEFGNGLYPTDATAKQLGVTRAQLEPIFWGGIATDPAKLAAAGATVKAALAAGKEVRITADNGTDLKLSVAARPVLVSDGVISADEAKQGGSAAWVWLPAGEAYVAPVAGSANGKVVFDRMPFRSGFIEGLTLTIASGKVTEIAAKPSAAFDEWKKQYDAAKGRKDELSAIDIGLNPDVKSPNKKPLLSWVCAGMVTIGIGNNSWAAGDNDGAYGWAGHLPGATVAVDGKALVERGALVAK